MIINEIKEFYTVKYYSRQVFIAGRKFIFIDDCKTDYKFAAVSPYGLLCLYEALPTIIRTGGWRGWTDGSPFKSLMLAKVKLDSIDGGWSESLTNVVIEDHELNT